MEPGKAYLIHCGDWHTFVGRCSRQVSPLLYELENSSKISNTNNGDNWHKLASGHQREDATYIHDFGTTKRLLPVSITCVEWVGETPKEAGLPGDNEEEK